MDSNETGMNPVTMTIINLQKEYWLSQGANQGPPVLRSFMLLTELLRLGILLVGLSHFARMALTFFQMINFRRFQTESLQLTISNLIKMAEVLQISSKHCGKKENCSLRANFSFSHCVFKRLALQTRKKQGLFGKGLTHYHTMPYFDTLRYIAVENIVRKGEIACNKPFLFSSQCFLPCMVLIFQFKCTLKCHLQFVSIWTSRKFCCSVMGYREIKPDSLSKVFKKSKQRWQI